MVTQKKMKIKRVEKLIDLLNSIVSIIFFVGCSTFVAIRGYKCIKKFLTKPQSNRISYEFNGRVLFPAISICPLEEPGIKINELTKCKLSQEEYFLAGRDI